MRVLEETEFNAITPVQVTPTDTALVADEELPELIATLNSPVLLQKELIVKVNRFLHHRMNKEITETGTLLDNTRKWVVSYNEMLNGLQKNMFGEKSMNVHVHSVTHTEVGALVRKHAGMSMDDAEKVILNVTATTTTTE